MLKKRWPILLFILLFAGLFWSRALLSLTTGAWFIFALTQLKKKSFPFHDPAFIWTCIPLLIWILGAWQDLRAAASWDYLLTLAAYPASFLILQSIDQKKSFPFGSGSGGSPL